jgi:ribosomal protein S18 acetylase RimI-like enzyme
VRSTTAKVSFRARTEEDDVFLLSVGRRVFASWSRDPARALAAMLVEPGARAEVAWVSEARVGFFIVGLDALEKPFGPWLRPVAARLDAIAVVPGAQGRGIGRALLERAEELARDRGGVVMSLMTATDNHRARRLFHAAGYLPLIAFANGYANGDAALEMFKSLDDSVE